MKLIYACALPAALAMPGGHNGGGAQHTPSTPTAFHPCEDVNTFDDQTDCLMAIYDDLKDIMDGKFSQKMKKNIGKMSEKHMDKNKTPSTPSFPSTPSTYSSSTGSSSEGTLTEAQAVFCEFVDQFQGDVKKAMKAFKKQEKMAEKGDGRNMHDFLMDDYRNELVNGMLPVDMCDDFVWNYGTGEMTYIGSSGSTPSTPSTYSSSSSEGTLTEAQAVFCEFVDEFQGDVKKAMKAFKKQEKEAEKEDGRNMHDFLMDDYKNELVNGMLPVDFCADFEWNEDGELSYMGDHGSHDHGSNEMIPAVAGMVDHRDFLTTDIMITEPWH